MMIHMLHDAPATKKAETPENVSSSSDTKVEDVIWAMRKVSSTSLNFCQTFSTSFVLASMLDIASEKKLSL